MEKRTGYEHSCWNAHAEAFDRRTAGEWIARNVPATRSRLRTLMREYFSEEFGLNAGRLTATDLLYLTEGPHHGRDPAGSDPSDERFPTISRGGNELVAHGLAERLPEGSLHLDAPLTALWRRNDGSYGLRFDGISDDVIADRVVVAIPYTTLREVDLSHAGFRKLKRRCIAELGMGTNAKVILQFRERPERFGDWNGELVTDQPFLDTWQSSLGQPGRAGLITVYSGGRVGAGYPGRPAPTGATRHGSGDPGRTRPRRPGESRATSTGGPGSTTGPPTRGRTRTRPSSPGSTQSSTGSSSLPRGASTSPGSTRQTPIRVSRGRRGIGRALRPRDPAGVAGPRFRVAGKAAPRTAVS